MIIITAIIIEYLLFETSSFVAKLVGKRRNQVAANKAPMTEMVIVLSDAIELMKSMAIAPY